MGPNITAVLTKTPEIYDILNPPSLRFPTPQTRRILRNILNGLRFLHKNNIVHGDLQPGNFLFSLQHKTMRPSNEKQEFHPLERFDGKVDKWAPKYLVIPQPLAEEDVPSDQQEVKVADFGSGTSSPVYHAFCYFLG